MAAKMLCARGQRKLRKDFIRATNFNGFKWQLKLLYICYTAFQCASKAHRKQLFWPGISMDLLPLVSCYTELKRFK